MPSPRITALTVTVALLCVLPSACAREDPRNSAPSIFVYLIDALRADHLGCYGYPRRTSPNIDAMARDGFVFANASAPTSWTRPSIAALFTGLPPTLHGVRSHNGWLAAEFVTWAERLQERGYRTEALVSNPGIEPVWGFGQGFERFEAPEGESIYYPRADEMHARWLQTWEPPGDRPLFQYIHTMDPHWPYGAPEQFQKTLTPLGSDVIALAAAHPDGEATILELTEQYDCEVLHSDWYFGQFIDELKRAGVYDNSWVVVIADHGEQLWEHGVRGHTNGLWEILLRVPMVVKPPGGRDGPAARLLEPLVDRAVALHALPDLIGASLGSGWTGLGEQNARALGLEDELIAQCIPRPEMLTPPLRRASLCAWNNSAIMVERDGLKLLWQDRPVSGILCFDLKTDPEEKQNLWPERAPLGAAALLEDLRQWVERTARGLEIEYIGTEPGHDLVLRNDAGVREVALAPMSPGHLDFPRSKDPQVRWSPASGSRLFLRSNDESAWTVSVTGKDPMPLLSEQVSALGVAVHRRSFGQEFSTRPNAGSIEIPDELQEKLRALGYID